MGFCWKRKKSPKIYCNITSFLIIKAKKLFLIPCKISENVLLPMHCAPHHIYYTFEGVYNWRSNTVVKGSISTSKPFDIFFSGSCCWSLGGLEDVEVVSSLEVAETLEEDSLPSFAIFDPCCGSRIFSLKRVVLTTFVWLFCFLALCVLLNL